MLTFALTVPLLLFCYFYPADNFKNMIKNLVMTTGPWLIGYIGMWSLRWILSTLLTDNNVITDALASIIHRANSEVLTYDYPFGSAIFITFDEFFREFYNILFILTSIDITIIPILFWAKDSCRLFKEKYFQILPFFLISLGTPLYCLIVQGHTIQHAPFAYRLWSGFFMSIIVGLNVWAVNVIKNRKRTM